jgi:hypothetical protein
MFIAPSNATQYAAQTLKDSIAPEVNEYSRGQRAVLRSSVQIFSYDCAEDIKVMADPNSIDELPYLFLKLAAPAL